MFRFFDKKNKKFRYDLFVSNDGIFEIYNDYGGMFSSGLRKDLVSDQYVLQRDTGLVGKDGTKIYEGDLISFDIYKNEEVIFQNGRFTLKDGKLLPTSQYLLNEVIVNDNITDNPPKYDCI